MRKITVLSFITLDGVMQAPGGPDEDTSNGFEYGGWVAPFSDDQSGQVMQREMEPADLLLGRKTFEIFANYWPHHADTWPGIIEVNKYCLSTTIKQTDPLVTGWKTAMCLRVSTRSKNLKNQPVPILKFGAAADLFSFC